MSQFLETAETLSHILNIISQAKEEVVLIVPYIKLSDEVFECLQIASNKGIEIIIVYRENYIYKDQLNKLQCIKNSTLFSHPDIHAKCYFNEVKMVITSMNLHDYSIKNNREMGVLIESEKDLSSNNLFLDAVDEARSIITSAKLVKQSAKNLKMGFNLRILKSNNERIKEILSRQLVLINNIFLHKRFAIEEKDRKLSLVCSSYFEKAILRLDYEINPDDKTNEFVVRRFAFDFNWDEIIEEKVNKKFLEEKNEYRFPGFKIYWNSHYQDFSIYRNKDNNCNWQGLELHDELEKFKGGLEKISEYILKIYKPFK